jgi:hypothetical protein
MMARGGGVELAATTVAELEKMARRYVADYRPEDLSDTEWNAAILRAVIERRFTPYGRGCVRAVWPGGATIH